MRRFLMLLAALAVLAVAPAAAHAGPNLISIMQDDDQLLYHGDETRDAALKRMRGLGVDYARATVLWSVVAENAKRDRRGRARRNFKPDNPRTYPRGNWDRFDRLVRSARANRVNIYFNLTGPGPSWAHAKAPARERRNRKTWKPKAREFFKFVKAVGRRYDGTYRDENDGRTILPKVDFWSIWNEPNQPGWLTPQYERGVPVAPALYRELWYYGRAALDSTGHGRDAILIGETAPLGSTATNTRSPIHPKKFIRELFCLNPSNQAYTGSAATRRRCGRLVKLNGQFNSLAWAHHPYTKTLAPTQRDARRDSITMANVNELVALLTTAEQVTGIKAPDLSVMTEFGYETDPPDPYSGVPPATQAEYINVGEWLAYQDPTVLGQAQFLLRDVKPVRRARGKRRWFTYQSGLFTNRGAPKPSANAYAMPLVVVGKGVDSVNATTIEFWGGVRFLAAGTPSQVFMQYRQQGSSQFVFYGSGVKVNFSGYFRVGMAQPSPGTWRAVWVNPVNGQPQYSREVEVRG